MGHYKPHMSDGLLLGIVLFSCCVEHSHSQSYPTKPARMIIGFPPGSITDVMVRPLAQKLADILGQQVIVDNRAGATGTIANEAVVKSATQLAVSPGIPGSGEVTAVVPGRPSSRSPPTARRPPTASDLE